MNGIFLKIAAIYKFFVVVALIVIIKIVYVQYISDEKIKVVENAFRDEEIPAMRGDILAKDGSPLATSIPYYEVRLDCTVSNIDTFQNNVTKLSKALADFYKDKTAKQYETELRKARKDKNRYKKLSNKLIDYSELNIVKKFPILRLGQNKGGIIIIEKYTRKNPYGRLAFRTVGFTNTLGVGVGIEGSSDYYLKGQPGKQVLQKFLGGEWRPLNSSENTLPKDGYDIQTTIDIGIQEAAEKALREQLSKGTNVEGATAIVMEVATGAIRAIANMKKSANGGYDESYNYAIGDATEPGSVFKLITLVALLEDRCVNLDTPIDAGNGKWNYGGHTYSDVTPGGYGLVSVKKAFGKSSNVAFAKLAVEYYGGNEKKFVDRIHSMKVGERFNLDIQGEARSAIYSPGDAMWSRTSLSSMAIGYATLLTPLHTLTFYNAIANNGKMMKPYFIECHKYNGEVVTEFKPQEISGAICSKSTAKAAQEALRGVVEEGTGKSFNTKEYQIAGKTGTARMAYSGGGYERNGYRRYQASFAGYFPANNPKYTAVVILYSGDTRGNFYGGSQAGPVFKQISDYIYSTSSDWNSPIESSVNTEKDPKLLANIKKEIDKKIMHFNPKKDSLIDLTNMGLKDALYILENIGCKVNFTGYGKIINQSPKPGSSIDKNTIINLELKENGA